MIKAWLLTSPASKNYWYENLRFLDEMKKRGLDTQHINPDMCTVVNDDVYIGAEKIIPPDLVIMRHAVWNTIGLKKLEILKKYGTVFVADIDPHIEALDKINAHKKYEKAGIPLAKTIFVDLSSESSFDEVDNIIGYPCVVKWRFAAGSEKVFLCKDEFELYAIAGNLIKALPSEQFYKRFSPNPTDIYSKHNTTVVVQEYLDLDYMIAAHAVRGRNVQAMMQVIPPSFVGYSKFQANFASHKDRVQLPIKACNELKDLIDRSLSALNVEWGRIDIFPTKEGFKLCEVNPAGNPTTAEMTSLQNLVGHMIDHAIEIYQSVKR